MPDDFLNTSRYDRVLEIFRKILKDILIDQETNPNLEKDPLRTDCQVSFLCKDTDGERFANNQPPPLGTFFFPGAGFDGGYINDFVLALSEAGILRVNSATDELSMGVVIDAALSSVFTMINDIGGVVSAQPNSNLTSQFNLVGYSYGSLVAANTAAAYARSGVEIDHLVLIGSPISLRFLEDLKRNSLVKNVIVINLTEHGDPIYPGISKIELLSETNTLRIQQSNGTGHFYYAPDNDVGKSRRRELGQQLFDMGLR